MCQCRSCLKNSHQHVGWTEMSDDWNFFLYYNNNDKYFLMKNNFLYKEYT